MTFRAIEERFQKYREYTYTGMIVRTGSQLGVNVAGNVLPTRWPDAVTVTVGTPVLVKIINGEAFVLQALSPRARSNRGVVTVVPPGSSTISITSEGETYTARFNASYSPVVNDEVILDWDSSIPTVIGKVAVPPPPAPPPPPVPPPPPPPTLGQANYAAADSDTLWGPGGWGSWAGGRGRVYQGSYGSGPVSGAWFYHNAPGQLAGASVDRLRIVLGGRINAGSYNSGLMVHFYLHSSPTKPGGDVTRITGNWDHWVEPRQGPREYDLPVDWGDDIIGGAGISIYGEPYMGFYGMREQPESGKLIIDWRR